MSNHNSFRPNQGYIYALSNPCFPYLKIGATKNNIKDRCRQLSKPTGVPKPFKIVYSVFVDDYMDAEKKLHIWFEDKHVSKEFFDITVGQLEDAVESFLKPVNKQKAVSKLLATAMQKLSFD